MSDKLPALHFYVQDYLADTRFLSNEMKGFYVDTLCYMHKSSRRGFLQQPSGNPYSPEQLGNMTGCPADDASRLLTELINLEVISATHQGVPFSRRMVRDEKNRQLGIKNGKKGGNPKLTHRVNPPRYPFPEDENEDENKKGRGSGGRGKKPPPKPTSPHPFFSDPEFRLAWDGWLEMRRKKRSPATGRAEALAMDELIGLAGGDVVKATAIVNKSTLKSWLSFYPLGGEIGTHRQIPRENESWTQRNSRRLKEEVAGITAARDSLEAGDSPNVRFGE